MTKSILKALFTLVFFIGVLMFLTKLKYDATDKVYIKSKPKASQVLPDRVKNKIQEDFENLDE